MTVNIPGLLDRDAKVLLRRVDAAAIESEEGYAALTDSLALIKRRRDALQNDRIDIKKPVTALGRTIDEQYWTVISILDSAISAGNRKLVAYDDSKRPQSGSAGAEAQARAEAVRRRAGEAVAVAPTAAATVAAAAQFTARAEVPFVLGNSLRRSRPMSWQWNVTDYSKIDRKWLTVNEREINKVVAARKDKALEVLGEGFGIMYEYTLGLTPNR